MKRLVIGFIGFIWLASSCAPAASQATSLPVTNSATYTPSPLPTSTTTPTASVTPLPTIPTFTLTFDASTIVTVTPAPKAECPKEPPNEVAQSLAKELESTEAPILMDITNDGLQEIILSGKNPDGIDIGSIFIYGCQEGSYFELQKITTIERPPPQLVTIQDLNSNGLPEIAITIRTCGGFGSCWVILVLEWDGKKFQNLEDAQINQDLAPWLNDLIFEDVDQDGITEIIVQKGLPSHPDSLLHGPWRSYTTTYAWNGEKYVLKTFDIDQAQFRFQALQDADYASTIGNFNTAKTLYQDVIFRDLLDWWSKERYLRQFQVDVFGNSPTPTLSAPDLSEYPRLAAYAYYRIMLLYFAQGNETEATTTYNTLQQTFGNDQHGRPYVEMAIAFWEAYQSTHKMYDGCAAAIQYAVEHPEILSPLGSDYHGWQSKTYKPEDVCPFR